MSDWLRPIGRRPLGLLRIAGLMLLSLIYMLLVTLVAGAVLHFVLLNVPPIASDALRIALGAAYVVAIGLLVPFLVLANISQFPRLQWTSWWLLLVDALLRLAFAAVRAAGAPLATFGYGMSSFWLYDFNDTRFGSVTAAVLTAGCTLIILSLFSKRMATGAKRTRTVEPTVAS